MSNSLWDTWVTCQILVRDTWVTCQIPFGDTWVTCQIKKKLKSFFRFGPDDSVKSDTP